MTTGTAQAYGYDWRRQWVPCQLYRYDSMSICRPGMFADAIRGAADFRVVAGRA
jgi:hypothetical protein